MTYRFTLKEVNSAMVTIHDKQLDCEWVLSIQFWFCINGTELDDKRNEEITEALYSNAVNCIVKGN